MNKKKQIRIEKRGFIIIKYIFQLNEEIRSPEGFCQAKTPIGILLELILINAYT